MSYSFMVDLAVHGKHNSNYHQGWVKPKPTEPIVVTLRNLRTVSRYWLIDTLATLFPKPCKIT